MSEPVATCAVCGRRMPQRKAARAHDVRKYCSAACRSQKLRASDFALEAAIMRLLRARGRGQTIGAADVAAYVFGATSNGADGLERARRAARRLVAAGEIDIVQQGRVVDGSTARGPIDLRLR